MSIFCSFANKITRGLSSVGLERLPYKQKVVGSTPSAPTKYIGTFSWLLYVMMYCVYLIKSDLGFNYIGQTKNLDDRLKRHNSNRNTFTKNKGNWQLVLKKEFF
jgi:hypothetical protein